MKKLSRRLKSIIIASVSFVCVLAITLGCVFGLAGNKNNNGENGNNNPPAVDVQYQQFLATQANFAGAIKKPTVDAVIGSADFSALNGNVVSNVSNGSYVFANGSDRELYAKLGSNFEAIPSTYETTDSKNLSRVYFYGDNVLLLEQFPDAVPSYNVLTVLSETNGNVVYKAQL